MAKSIEKQLKKHLKGATLFFAILFLVIGCAIGYFAYNILNNNQDKETKIELIGEDTLKINLGDEYKELGCKFIIDDVDYTELVKIEGKVNENKAGVYIITYSLNEGNYNVELSRVVYVLGGEANGE